MKNIILALAVILSLNSCKKDYVCVCTDIDTGEKTYGDHFKAGPFLKKAAKESCEANDDVFESDIKDCHLE